MYLKRLDLQGFKSFPDKIKLEFNKGITAVVGPNGSGKSNISDAVRWVLGEQSAKNLRGAKMEDVIFNGTANRKPLSMAEVSLTIDNADGKIPLDYAEVTVSRRVYRSGDSEYLLNGSSCRLRDIHEMFMDTGIGKEGYSIIGQGRIDEILSAKSDERRLLFEEAAGIVKFKNRKTEAEAKLVKEAQNLGYINNVIAELEAMVEPLQEQAETTKRYITLIDRLKKIDVHIFLTEAARYGQEIEKINAECTVAQDELVEEKKKQEQLKQLVSERKEDLAEIEQDLAQTTTAINENKRKMLESENSIRLYEEQITSKQADVRRINKDIVKQKEKERQTAEELQRLTAANQSIQISLLSETAQKEAYEKQFADMGAQLTDSENKVKSDNAELIEKYNQISNKKSKREYTQSLLRENTTRQKQLDTERKFTASQINDKKIHIMAMEKKRASLEMEEQSLQMAIEEQGYLKQEALSDLKEKRTSYEGLTKKINEDKSRYKVLTDMEREYEGFNGSVKRILQIAKSGAAAFSGICGAVGELLETAPQYEIAIEIALGTAVQNIIAQSEKDVSIAIDYLKQNNFGRATFLPLTAIKGRDLTGEREQLFKQPGVIGTAKELILYDKKYESIFSNLLGSVLVIDNKENANALSIKFKNRYKLVTLSGELYSIGGAITGGSLTAKRTGVFSRHRQIKELQAQITQRQEEAQALQKEISAMEGTIEAYDRLIQEKQQEKNNLHMKMNTLLHDLVESGKTQALLQEKLKDIDSELRLIQEQFSSYDEVLEKSSAAIQQVEDEINELQKAVEEATGQIQENRRSREEVAEKITSQRIKISALLENKKANYENVTRLKEEAAAIQKEIIEGIENVEQLEKVQVEKGMSIEEIRGLIFQLRAELEGLQELHEKLTRDKSIVTEWIKNAEQQAEEINERLAVLNDRLFQQKARAERLETEKDFLYQQMWEQYEMTLQQAKRHELIDPDMALPALQREQRALKTEIKEMGAVNVGAIEEFKALQERFTFLTTQRNDIVAAENQLREIIKELTTLMEKQFLEQIQVISENFNIVFSEMFGGGQAYLKLTDTEDILQSGIEINCCPPGKKLQNMLLLSGGERALTAIALLFAILRMKPSPFCILDEIEAALDDANVLRFANYLSHFAHDTQFILITHRKGTMESADVLYGVTMQEQGVSRLVSVRFSDL